MKAGFDTIRAVMRPLALRVARLISSGQLVSTDDAHGLQVVTFSALNGERFFDATRIQQFGFSSFAPAGARLLFVCPGGARSQPIVIAIDDPASRPQTLSAGQSIQYDQAGNYVWIKNDGNIEIKASTKVKVIAPDAEFTGNVKIDGNCHVVGNTTMDGTLAVTGAITGSSTAAIQGALSSATSVADPTGTLGTLRTDYNAHKHTGVQSGSSSTGTTDHPA